MNLERIKKTGRKGKLRWLIVICTFGIPLILLLVGVVIFVETSLLPKVALQETAGSKETFDPSEVLNNKFRYNRQRIVIKGKVSPEPVVCQRQECPQDDSCCGCPKERNLLIADAGTILRSKTKGRLRLLDSEGKSFCQRKPFSCEYDCGDWNKGAVYEVVGVFSAEPPPPGWQLSLDYYFQAENKRLVREITFGFSVGNVFKDITEFFGSLKTSGSYVLY